MKKTSEQIATQWILDHPDIIDICLELAHANVRDRLIYGYNHWDYLEETKLNIKLQGGKIK